MAQQHINTSTPNDNLGDTLRDANIKSENNFTDLYGNKVDKVSGKGLSTNDYTTGEKNKLAGIPADAEKNVQADFLTTDTNSDSYIKNKPNFITDVNWGDIGGVLSGQTDLQNALDSLPTFAYVDSKVSQTVSSGITDFAPSENAVYFFASGKENKSEKNIPDGYAGLDSAGKILTSQLPSSIMEYKGVYNAATNTPPLVNGSGDTGDVYRVTVSGAGVNSLNFVVGDYAVYNGSTWEKQHSGADNVVSVFGRAGVISAQTGDYNTGQVTEAINKNYQTDNQKLFNDATSSIQGQFDDLILDMSGKADVSYVDTQDAELMEYIISLAKATCQTGILDISDTVFITQTSNTTFDIEPITSALFHDKLYTGDTARKSFPKTSHNVSEIPMIADSTSVWCVGKDYNGNIQFSQSSYSQIGTVVGIGWIYIRKISGAYTFLFTGVDSRNTLTIPDIVGYSSLEREVLHVSSTVKVEGNANLTLKTNAGLVQGMSVNWQAGINTTLNNKRVVPAQATMQFLRLNPSTRLTATPPAITTILDVTTYWNGTAMVAVPSNNNATVQAIYISAKGGIVILAGEKFFATYDDAVKDMWQVDFTSLLPGETFTEIARVVATKNCTNLLANNAKVESKTSHSSGGGSSDATKEDTANKTDDYVNNQTSSVKFLSVKGVENFWTWIKSQAQTITGIWNFEQGLKVEKVLGGIYTYTAQMTENVLSVQVNSIYGLVRAQYEATIIRWRVDNFTTSFSPISPTKNNDIVLPDKSGTVALINYKVYTAELFQTGTNNPTANISENTIGNIIWTRDSLGTYSGVLSGAFPIGKVIFLQGGSLSAANRVFRITRIDVNTVRIVTNINSGGFFDDVLVNTCVEIRVYN